MVSSFLGVPPPCATTIEEIYVRASFLCEQVQAVKENILLLAVKDYIDREISAQTLLSHVATAIAATTGAEQGRLLLLDRDHQELVVVTDSSVQGQHYPLRKGLVGFVARTRHAINIPFDAEDTRRWKTIDAPDDLDLQSMLAVPIMDHNDSLLGVLQLFNHKKSFDEDVVAQVKLLASQVSGLLEETTLGQRQHLLLGPPTPQPPLHRRVNKVVAQGRVMQQVINRVMQLALGDEAIQLRGESGTGKSLLARAIHHNSLRASGPFVTFDCSAVSEGLAEAVLFGQKAGAFVGAEKASPGKLELANGGTLFLDKVDALPLELQAALVTVFESAKFCRMGEKKARKLDLRLVSATKENLEELVIRGRFREDLYLLLKGAQVELPTLAERGRADMQALTNHFVFSLTKSYGFRIQRIAPDAFGAMLNYTWPGNVRQLKHAIEAAIVSGDNVITLDNLQLPCMESPKKTAAPSSDGVPSPFEDQPTLKELEARYLGFLIQELHGNRSACSRVLGIGRHTLLRKLRSYGLSD